MSLKIFFSNLNILCELVLLGTENCLVTRIVRFGGQENNKSVLSVPTPGVNHLVTFPHGSHHFLEKVHQNIMPFVKNGQFQLAEVIN